MLLWEILLWKRVTMRLYAGDCLISCAFFHIGYDVFCAKEVDRYYKISMIFNQEALFTAFAMTLMKCKLICTLII